ncbi:MAG TPA: diaminopimelate epimerase [Flavipsychrobacter sp.]|nr:diaminopimelate epimerase [Flavipsychrobacter sp.]
MKLHFCKYQGTGNDFILLDNRSGQIQLTTAQIHQLCDRRFGIGADGLMLLELEQGQDFRMVYYNADGNESTMCGNGGRCIVAFAKRLGVIAHTARFMAIDGLHSATISEAGEVNLQMIDVEQISHTDTHSILNTGSPHYVVWVEDAGAVNVFGQGRQIRNQDEFQPKGINVNFAQVKKDTIIVRTYERGVEDETYSCGTGVTAVAIASVKDKTGQFDIAIETPGGKLSVSFEKDTPHTAINVLLSGAATYVFEGDIEI